MNCEECMNYGYDEEYGLPVCMIELDEDEAALFMQGRFDRCPYYHQGDEYSIVRKQI